MKSSLVRTLLTLGLSAALSPVALRAQDRLNASIPFDFTVGSKTLAAGTYLVSQMRHNVLLIRNADTGASVIALTLTGEPSKTPDRCTLRFAKYGDRYFLSTISGTANGWEMIKSPAEKELIAEAASPKPVVVAGLPPK
jgi:hypothetical protein